MKLIICIVNVLSTIIKFYCQVENYWDLWLGRYPWLAKMSIGDGDNVIYPFDKYNNGGYVIKDRHGDIARIDPGIYAGRQI
ncbi:MAG: hypothetical protein ACMUIP_11175 [bacterium]